MTPHTPAPWKADIENSAEGLNITDDEGRRIAHTATIRNPDYTPLISEEAKANARLIAAAPELLEALKELTDLLQSPSGAGTMSEIRDSANRARAALAKAEGES